MTAKSHDAANQKVYQAQGVARQYLGDALQAAEIEVFNKYRKSFVGRRVLDVGCGGGRTSSFLLPLCEEYVGIDYSKEMIEHCRARFAAAQFKVCDVRDMSIFRDGWFDSVVFSFNGLDYVNHEGRLQGLKELRRVLTNGGLFVFSAHNRNFREARNRPALHFSMNPYRQLRRLAGFVIAWWNHLRNRKREFSCDEYEIINDCAHRWSLLTYYIDKMKQVEQLERAGFTMVGMYDTFGNQVDTSSDDQHACYIYYVARKRSV